MAELVTDLEAIAAAAQRDERRNLSFRVYLRNLDWSSRRLDGLVHEILEEVASQIDCTKCANCCRVMGAAVLPADSKRLAARLGMSKREFESTYTTPDDEGGREISLKPCPFLDDCTCTVYDDRPRDCREYPHIQKTQFRSRLYFVLANAEICPIVFNVLEQLKEHFRWSGRGR